MKRFLIIILIICVQNSFAGPALVSSLQPHELEGYDQQPQPIQELIKAALNLTEQKLTYLFASNNPKLGGMDCSGTIQHLLHSQGVKSAPRQANHMHGWLKANGKLHQVSSTSLDSDEFKALKPGHLLFWSGTYNTARKITHVMLYLGIEHKTQRPVMFGASDGRRYKGMKRRGVSVFDFKLPTATSRARFVGYGEIPGLSYNTKAEPGDLTIHGFEH